MPKDTSNVELTKLEIAKILDALKYFAKAYHRQANRSTVENAKIAYTAHAKEAEQLHDKLQRNL